MWIYAAYLILLAFTILVWLFLAFREDGALPPRQAPGQDKKARKP